MCSRACSSVQYWVCTLVKYTYSLSFLSVVPGEMLAAHDPCAVLAGMQGLAIISFESVINDGCAGASSVADRRLHVVQR